MVLRSGRGHRGVDIFSTTSPMPSRGTHTTTKGGRLKDRRDRENNMDLLTFPKQEEKTTPERTTLVTVLLKKHPYCVKPAVVQHQKHVCQEQERILPVVAHEALVSVSEVGSLSPSLRSTHRHHEEEGLSFLLRRSRRSCEGEGLSLSLRGTNRRCVEEGLRCNPSSTEVHNDVVEVPLVHVRERAVCNPSSSEEATVDAEEDAGLGGWRACLSTPRETHNQRTTDASNPSRTVGLHSFSTKSGLHVRPTK